MLFGFPSPWYLVSIAFALSLCPCTYCQRGLSGRAHTKTIQRPGNAICSQTGTCQDRLPDRSALARADPEARIEPTNLRIFSLEIIRYVMEIGKVIPLKSLNDIICEIN